MNSVDFVMYCAGSGLLFLTAATAYKIVTLGSGKKSTIVNNAPVVRALPEPTTEEGLNKRLREFQEARFASPIVRRTLSQDAGPPLRPYARPSQVNTPRERPNLRAVPPAKQKKDE